MSLPHTPEIFVGFRERFCSFAILMDTGINSDKNVLQQRLRPADTNTTHDFGLVPHADLPQFNPRLKYRGQIFYQLPEVDSSLRGKIKQNLIIVKSILAVYELSPDRAF